MKTVQFDSLSETWNRIQERKEVRGNLDQIKLTNSRSSSKIVFEIFMSLKNHVWLWKNIPWGYYCACHGFGASSGISARVSQCWSYKTKIFSNSFQDIHISIKHGLHWKNTLQTLYCPCYVCMSSYGQGTLTEREGSEQ